MREYGGGTRGNLFFTTDVIFADRLETQIVVVETFKRQFTLAPLRPSLT